MIKKKNVFLAQGTVLCADEKTHSTVPCALSTVPCALDNKVVPIGISRKIVLGTRQVPQVYTPFQSETSVLTMEDGICTLTLPENCAYAILQF